MGKLIFSSDDLPPELDDQTRFKTWRDIYLGTICHFDVERATDRPFAMRYEFMSVGGVALARCEGTVDRIRRTPHHLASDPHDDFLLNFNGNHPWSVQIGNRAHDFQPRSVSVLSNADSGQGLHPGGVSFQGLVLSRSRIEELVRNPSDLLLQQFDPSSDVARHLKRYIEMLLAGEDVTADPAVAAHVEATLTDLVVLLLNGRRDRAELARLRGMRAARLQEVVSQIDSSFADPAFSPQTLALRIGLSANYVQKLLYESGASFTEHVLERRLQKGRAMLADRRHNGMKVSDIALACGFNEVSYFNRCFRRRFGASPTQYRG
jgi:AraC-like DNA-binding protein